MIHSRESCRRAYGFTFVELLLVVALTATMVAISVPLYVSFNDSQWLKSARSDLLTSLRYVQERSRNESQIGLYVNSTGYSIYNGSSYEGVMDHSLDQITYFPDSIQAQGIIDVHFSETGVPFPFVPPPIILENQQTGVTMDIVIEAGGLIY